MRTRVRGLLTRFPGGGCVTDVYTFDALADEMVRKAAPAVDALG